MPRETTNAITPWVDDAGDRTGPANAGATVRANIAAITTINATKRLISSSPCYGAALPTTTVLGGRVRVNGNFVPPGARRLSRRSSHRHPLAPPGGAALSGCSPRRLATRGGDRAALRQCCKGRLQGPRGVASR